MSVEKIYKKTNQELTLKELLMLMVTDIDIFLLKEENQIEDKNCTFSVEEVRNQLKETLAKFLGLYNDPIVDVLNTPMYKASKIYTIHRSGLSKSEKIDVVNQIIKE